MKSTSSYIYMLTGGVISWKNDKIKYIDTNSMVENLLTKGLPQKMFHEHIACVSVMSLSDVQF
uniref:Retrovirus-related Pol polyprotein from transposon TNT 1-94 n=1 Tax=Cajanus cajan TaxID=3821 RepID=A0A151TE59_CAJCA|nr:hypothetical protein KK1_011546 [Cajanus cajan]